MFGPRFSGSSCKTKLKLVVSRIKLVRNKRTLAIRQLKREIANLLANNQEANARIRVEHVIREENTIAAYDIIELFCELVAVRMPVIEASKKDCPPDLKEAISSIIWAAPRCSDLPELIQARGLFAALYGKEFTAAASELRPECGVNRKIIQTMSVEPPSMKVKLELLKEIAKQEGVDWDSSNYEKEVGNLPLDLLEGSKYLPTPSDPEPPLELPSVPPPQKKPPPGHHGGGGGEASSPYSAPPVSPPAARPAAPPPVQVRPTEPPSPPPARRTEVEPASSPLSGDLGGNQFIPFAPPMVDPETEEDGGVKRPYIGVGSARRTEPLVDLKNRQHDRGPSYVEEAVHHAAPDPDLGKDPSSGQTFDSAQAAAQAASMHADKAVSAALAAQRLAAEVNVTDYLKGPPGFGGPAKYDDDSDSEFFEDERDRQVKRSSQYATTIRHPDPASPRHRPVPARQDGYNEYDDLDDYEDGPPRPPPPRRRHDPPPGYSAPRRTPAAGIDDGRSEDYSGADRERYQPTHPHRPEAGRHPGSGFAIPSPFVNASSTQSSDTYLEDFDFSNNGKGGGGGGGGMGAGGPPSRHTPPRDDQYNQLGRESVGPEGAYAQASPFVTNNSATSGAATETYDADSAQYARQGQGPRQSLSDLGGGFGDVSGGGGGSALRGRQQMQRPYADEGEPVPASMGRAEGKTGPPSQGYGIGIQGSPFEYDKVEEDDDFPPIAPPRGSRGGSRDQDGYRVVNDPPPSGVVKSQGLSPPPGQKQQPQLFDFLRGKSGSPVSAGTRPSTDSADSSLSSKPKVEPPPPASTAPSASYAPPPAQQDPVYPEGNDDTTDNFTKRIEALRRGRN